jgi:hypothetical protein
MIFLLPKRTRANTRAYLSVFDGAVEGRTFALLVLWNVLVDLFDLAMRGDLTNLRVLVLLLTHRTLPLLFRDLHGRIPAADLVVHSQISTSS